MSAIGIARGERRDGFPRRGVAAQEMAAQNASSCAAAVLGDHVLQVAVVSLSSSSCPEYYIPSEGMSTHHGNARDSGGIGLMALNWSQEIIGFLSDAGIGTPGEDLFWGVMPDTPKFCIAVIPYPGPAARTAVRGHRTCGWWFPRAQLSCRAGAPDQIQDAFETAQLAMELLQRVQVKVIGGTLYHRIQPLQTPFVIDIDESGLPVVGFNFEVERDVTTRAPIAFDEGFDLGFM